ncbi:MULTISPECIES: NAD(P)H-binding protein [unclassified Rhizobium]|uniref:NmrA family NAD(P)-binding protein n=1 Tax=unclassified Rhizobium TaxID=2613769 RepID=UPI000EAA143A|nr:MULTISPECIES: NAD(P)H-binding protein [unclassified Rhizobium]AYG69186.1 NmrA family transcriptional regulator [Rhizobium sp. CCGE531]AYG75566.1 NmrA family transcriptional regulator [Rhizobium sp. CCGE532]
MHAILGAGGKVGRTTIASLRKADVPVRAILRDPSKAKEFSELGCEVAMADASDHKALTAAFDGASAVQVICPVDVRAQHPRLSMMQLIESVGVALAAAKPRTVLAISDYGAQHSSGTGVTLIFHALEMRLRKLDSRLILLRSAEHMENWARLAKASAESGRLPSFYHPLTKALPTVSAFDVGAVAADLLLDKTDAIERIVHVEGPRRYTPEDVAAAIASLTGRDVIARPLPEADWQTALQRAGLSEEYAQLLVELYIAHNAGRIDAEGGVGEIRRGATEMIDVLRRLLKS